MSASARHPDSSGRASRQTQIHCRGLVVGSLWDKTSLVTVSTSAAHAASSWLAYTQLNLATRKGQTRKRVCAYNLMWLTTAGCCNIPTTGREGLCQVWELSSH
eukprot:76297-Chlamydomonas_euryale.AAC.6